MTSFRYNLLDTIFILLASSSLLLLILFLAGAVSQNPILHQLPNWIQRGSSAVWSVTTTALMATIIWVIRRQVNDGLSPNYWFGIIASTLVLALLVYVTSKIITPAKLTSKYEDTPQYFYEEALSLWDEDSAKFINAPLAIEYLNQASRLNSNNSNIYSLRGVAFYQMEQFKRSLRDFNSAINLRANDPEYHNWRGLVLWKIGETRRAKEDWKYSCNQLNSQYGCFSLLDVAAGISPNHRDLNLWTY